MASPRAGGHVVSRPLLYDVFCGAGGASAGYHRAGFDVIGIDHAPQKNYPFQFIQADAFDFFERVHRGELPRPDAWHCSPPCQGYSRMRHLPWLAGREYPLLIDPTRDALNATGRPWVIENVEDAPLSGIVLCGQAFGLPLYRHRRFESSVMLLSPAHQRHRVVIGSGRMLNDRAKPNGHGFVSLVGKSAIAASRRAMGIDWMARDEIREAIPPAYTKYVGEQIITYLRQTERAA